MSVFRNYDDLFIEFKENSIHVLDGDRGLDLPLERDPNGRLTPASLAEAAQQLLAFLRSGGTTSPRIANCAIPARGVSVRRIALPASASNDLQQLLALQLEAQMPVPPSELAWGCKPLAQNGSADGKLQEFLVVAVKRDLLSDYIRLGAEAGVASEFTVGALARRALCPGETENFSVVESSGTKVEVATFDPNGLLSIRVLSNSENSASASLPTQLGRKIYLSGPAQQFVQQITRAQPGIAVETLDGFTGPGRTAANLGFKKIIQSGAEPLLLGAHEAKIEKSSPAPWKWAALAAALAIVALSLRYAESVVFRARLTHKAAAISAYRSTLPKIEREFNFLNFIKTNQPPYLDVLTVLAQAASPGARIETLSLVRSGDLTLRGNTTDAQAPGSFRSKLIDSGFFSRVVVDEQTPSADGQKFTFRLSAQVKPDGTRKPLILAAETKSSATNAVNTPSPEPTRK